MVAVSDNLNNAFEIIHKLNKYNIKFQNYKHSQNNSDGNNLIYKQKINHYRTQLNKIIQNGGMKCSICLDDSNEINTSGRQQILLNCGHSFCNQCLVGARERNERTNNPFACPTCRQVVTDQKIISSETTYQIIQNNEDTLISLINYDDEEFVNVAKINPPYNNLANFGVAKQQNRLGINPNTDVLESVDFLNLSMNLLPLQVDDIPYTVRYISFGNFTNG
jgi:hypothetical protein